MARSEKPRLDALLVERGLADSRERAQRLIRAGVVWSGQERLDKPGVRVAADREIEVREDPCPYVSRGGLKLAGALDALAVDPAGLRCADIGASTGGFTDCLLQRGAAHVHTFDVGRHQLHERVREDPRVTPREQFNARHLTAQDWPEGVALTVIDVSFISLALILPALAPGLETGSRVLALVKPQFEAGPESVQGGVVRDRRVHREVLLRVDRCAQGIGLARRDACLSPLAGPAGNREHFVLWERADETLSPDPDPAWADALAEGATQA